MHSQPRRTQSTNMLGRCPRRFRTRVLLAFLTAGTLILVFCLYAPGHSSRINSVRRNVPNVAGWLGRLWPEESCWKGSPRPVGHRVDTGDVYGTLDFALPDNKGVGFWDEVLEKRYREIRNAWKDLPLEVIVVPHSHVDPGWLRTYDEYFDVSVNHILDNMVTFLNVTQDFTFIWSEISYFSKWWNRQNLSVQATVKNLLKRKQLEIVTGGWVMTDEATTSYFSVIDQLIEGHQWLKHFTDTIPRHGWSVDVFGHSATLPYILSSSGITDTVILRAHYAWKAFMAKMKWFDFYWEQPFESPRIFCHMGPSDIYSFKHTCGPNPTSCLNFDFRKVGGEMSESTSVLITDANVEVKANELLSQYGRFASLFSHNVLLVPLGDDFRYNILSEWQQQYQNFKTLYDYINRKKEWNVRVRFGTVADYFDEVHKRLENNTATILPSIQGDFLPYADIFANNRPSYWTGFYTTRPFYKKLSHELEHWLRSSEILYSFAKTMVEGSAKDLLLKDYTSLISARQALALFQHHDAITGTSKEFVMADYGRQLHSGITDAMSITSHLAQMLLMEKVEEGNTWTSQVYPDVYKTLWNYPVKKKSLSTTDDGRKFILFNPLTTERTEVVRLKVRSANIRVVDLNGENIPCQINPTWKNTFTMSNSVFELLFVVTMKPLSFLTYNLVKVNVSELKIFQRSVISLFVKDDSKTPTQNSAFKFENPKGRDINLESSSLKAKLSASGTLKEIYLKKSGISQSVDIDFRAYKPWIYRSGAYLFQPDTPVAIPFSNLTDHFPFLCAVRGPIVSEMNIMYNNFFKFSIRLYHFKDSPSGLQLEVSPDLSKLNKNVELVMRIHSNIENDGVFFTDSNGLQILKRKYVPSQHIQGNYYPATSAMYIEDKTSRLNLLLPHSHGVTSPFSGTMEVMIDRRIGHDDGRGMGEGVQDNQMISTTFWLVPEPLRGLDSSEGHALSAKTHMLSMRSQYPIITLLTDSKEVRMPKPELSFLSESWPSDVHLVNLRTLPNEEDFNRPSNSSLMIVHERYDPCKTRGFVDSVIENIHSASFSNVIVRKIEKSSLTGTLMFSKKSGGISSAESLSKLQACKVTFD